MKKILLVALAVFVFSFSGCDISGDKNTELKGISFTVKPAVMHVSLTDTLPEEPLSSFNNSDKNDPMTYSESHESKLKLSLGESLRAATRENLNFEVEMKVTAPNAKSDTSTLFVVSYGDITQPADYCVPDNKPDKDNKIAIDFPIIGSITLGDDVDIDAGRWDAIDKKANAVLTLMGTDTTFTYTNEKGVNITKTDDNKKVEFKFDCLWSEDKTDAAPFANGGMLSLACEITIPLEIQLEQKNVTFHIVSNGNAGTTYYSAEKFDTLFVPLIQIYAQQHVDPEQQATGILHDPSSQIDGTAYSVQYGLPANPVSADYKYPGNIPDSSGNVEVMLPLNGTITFKNTNDYKAEILGLAEDFTPVITLTIPGKDPVKYNYPTADTARFFTISPDHTQAFFSFNPDWNTKVSASSLDGKECTFSAEFYLEVRVTEGTEEPVTRYLRVLVGE